MELFDMEEEAIKPSSRACLRHFHGGNSKQTPCLNLNLPYSIFFMIGFVTWPPL